ncbi:MAG: type II toxin-antitoxin system antitoxin SocA domain-containing protein [Patescibacteria group bacterium]
MIALLKKLRQKHNLSQEFLAKKIGVSRPTYVQIENGSRKMLVEEAQNLARFFGLSLEDFLAGRENLTPKVELEKKAKQTKSKKIKQEMRISVPQEKVAKFKEVLLYILEQIGARPNIGEGVVCKLMYFIDFDFYEKFEEQLMGAKYIKNHFGPTPIAFPEIVKQMEKDGDLTPVMKKYFQHDQKKYLPRRKADLSNFSAREKDIIDWEIERFKDFNATKMKEYSHKDVPWIGADDLQQIDYEAVFSRTDEFSVRQYDDGL